MTFIPDSKTPELPEAKAIFRVFRVFRGLTTNDQRLTTNRRYRTSTTATFSAKTSSRTKSALLGAVPDFDDSIAG